MTFYTMYNICIFVCCAITFIHGKFILSVWLWSRMYPDYKPYIAIIMCIAYMSMYDQFAEDIDTIMCTRYIMRFEALCIFFAEICITLYLKCSWRKHNNIT